MLFIITGLRYLKEMHVDQEPFIKHHQVHFRELEHSGMIRTTLTTKNYPVQNVNSAKTDKPWFSTFIVVI